MRKKIIILTIFFLGLFMVLTGCGSGGSNSSSSSSGSEGKKELVVVSWGGAGTDAQRAAWYEPFTKETGIKIIEVSPPSTSQIKAQVDSGNVEWDVVLLDIPNIDSLKKDGDYLENIPYDEMDQELLSNLPEEAKRDDGLGAYYWGWALAYRTDVFDVAPKGWEDFWDTEKFPGPRTMPDQPHSNMEVALMADGVKKTDLYPIDENMAEKALDKISEIEPEISSFWKAGAEGARLLADKEAVMGNVFATQAASLIRDGVPVAIQWNQGIYAMDYWVVPKGKMSDEVIQFLEFISQAERQADLSNELPYGPVNKEALQYVDEDIRENLVTHPENLEQMILYDNKNWWGSVISQYRERWEEWKLEQ